MKSLVNLYVASFPAVRSLHVILFSLDKAYVGSSKWADIIILWD
jgi:hypothetical protein